MTAAALAAGTSAFLGAFVEFVEALTVVLAIGTVRGWRDTAAGTLAALAVLGAGIAIAGCSLALLFTPRLGLALGLLVLLFGLRWLRKAVQRAAGLRALHDEAAAFAAARTGFAPAGPRTGFDHVAAAGAFNVVLIEGLEVVFIVAAIGAAPGLAWPATAGAALALAAVAVLGVALHRPLAAVPENTLKLAVGVLMCAFGTFWAGEGLGAAWPGGDLALPGLAAFWALAALAAHRAAAV